jgi:DNA-directed RNA polymerase subunit M/transcription elongation factor TFIIS
MSTDTCPKCGSTNVSEGPIESVSGDQATCEVECLDCGHAWSATFTLTEQVSIG